MTPTMDKPTVSRVRIVGIVVLLFAGVWSAIYLVLIKAIPIPRESAWAILTAIGGMFLSLAAVLYVLAPLLTDGKRPDAANQTRTAIGNWPGAMGVGWVFVGIATLPFLNRALRVVILILGIAVVMLSFKKLNERVRTQFQR
jgi:hypothetical protein